MAWWEWSTTAANNGTADPTISWPEGMAPSSVNDSARSMMARTADYRNLISGALATTGTGTAYALASGQNPVFDTLAHMDGQMFAFVPNVTNIGPLTLAVDGLTAKPLRSQTGASGELGAGVLILGTPYVVTYYNAVGEFLLQGFVGQPYAVPLGSFMFHSVATPPNSNFVLPIGQAISRTTYATYFAMVGTTFGIGDGTTTFNVPDLRSRMLLPLATMGGADPGRVNTAGSGIDGATIGAVGGAQNITLDTTMIPAHSHTATSVVTDPGHTHVIVARTQLAGTGGGADMNGTGNNKATNSATTGISVATSNANTGGGLAHNNMPPSFVLPVLLRIL